MNKYLFDGVPKLLCEHFSINYASLLPTTRFARPQLNQYNVLYSCF
jgi:hypothetical protein